MKTIQEMKCETSLPILLANQQGFIIYVNEPFQAVFGWKNEQIIGQTIEAVIPNTFHDSHHLGFSRFVMTEQSRVLSHPFILKAMKHDGSEIDAEHFIIAEKQQGEWIFGAALRPVSDL